MTDPQSPYGPPPGPGSAGYGAPGYGTEPPGWPPAGGVPVPPAWGPSPYGQDSGRPQETSPKAIVALVLAIGSFVVFPLVPAIVALVLCASARRDIDASGGRVTGDGLLTASKIISWINIGLCIAAAVGFAVLFGLLAAGSTGP